MNSFVTRSVVCFVLGNLLLLTSVAQQGPPANPPASQQTPPADKSQKPQDPKPADKNQSGTSNDRLFYVLPNFLTLENAGQVAPLTIGEKFKVVTRGSFDYIQIPWYGFLAGISQAENSEPAFGQGWLGYAKRYGTTAGDSTVENFMVGAVFPSILRQDPRFYQSGKGGIPRRVGYSVSRIFVTRTDSGKAQFNFSEIFGAATAAAVSTYSYHPKSTFVSTPTNPHMFIASDRTLTNSASVYATQVGLDAITIVVKEFWPDVHRKLSHKSRPDQGSAGSAGP